MAIKARCRIAVDIGGTFTDVALEIQKIRCATLGLSVLRGRDISGCQMMVIRLTAMK